MSLSRRPEAGILGAALVGLALRLLVVACSPTELHRDGIVNDQLARSLAAGQGYTRYGEPSLERPPLYPAFLALVYELGGSPRAVVWLQALLGAGCVLLAGRLARRMQPEGPGPVLAAWMVALFPDLLAYPTLLISETWWSFLVLGGAVLAGLPWERRPPVRTLGAGVLLGAATLVRSNTSLLVAFWVVLALTAPRDRGRAFLRALGVALVAAAVVLPWTIRCTMLAERLVVVDVTWEGSLRLGHQPGHTGGKEPMVVPPGIRIPVDAPVHERTRQERSWALDEIRSHPRATLERTTWKALRLLHPRGDLELLDSPSLPRPPLWWLASTLCTEAFLLLLLCGAARVRWRQHAPALAAMLAVVAATLLTFFAARYRQPLLLFAPVVAAATLLRGRGSPRPFLCLVLLALHAEALVLVTWADLPRYLENLPRLF